MSIYRPYTYLIGWSKHNKFYYGVRYAKKCNPSDLWNTYFTSSKHVKSFCSKHGDPDIIQIRKVFANSESAREWENNVINKMNLVERKDFLNATNNISPKVSNFDRSKNFGSYIDDIRGKTYEEIYGKKKSETIKNKKSSASKKWWQSLSEEERKRVSKKPEGVYSKVALDRWKNPEFKNKMKSKRWLSNDKLKKSVFLSPDDYSILSKEWYFGRKYF